MSNGTRSANFDWGMHYLRGFAIVCIMLTHLWDKMGLSQVSSSILAGSTVYFLFISGYLCQYLALRRPPIFRDYIKKKFTNVISPYLVWTALTIVLMLLLGENRTGIVKLKELTIANLPKIFLLGWAQAPYWYIPFVFLLFLVSPWLSKTKTPTLVWLFAVSLAAAIVFPYRPPSHLTFEPVPWFFRFTYFTWCYLAGFLYARFKETIDRHLAAYAIPALALALLIGARLFAPSLFGRDPATLVDGEGEHVRAFVLGGPFAKSLQKSLFLVPVLVVANRLRAHRIALFDALATYSFSLFFTHHFFVADYVALEHWLLARLAPGVAGRVAIYLGLSVLFIAQNLILAIVLKKITGRRSRSVIGA